MSTALKTSFAPPERTPEHILLAQINKIESHSDITSVLHAIPEFVMILNKEREIVFANKSLLNYLAAEDDFLKRGFRPGEAINCQHAFENEAGCGTSEFCKTCGAVISILNSQSGQYEDVQECRIIQGDGCTALDLRVKSTRLSLEGEDFTVFTVADISNEKRRQALERIFFHDILNTAGGILGYTQILREAEPDELEIFSESIEELSNRLIEEIQAQKQLIAAEGGQLDIRPVKFSSARMVMETIELYKNHVVAEGKSLVPGEMTDIEIVNDRSLLGRVLGNMVKNAISNPRQLTDFAIGLMDNNQQAPVAQYQVDINIWQMDRQHSQVYGYKLQNAFPKEVGIVTLDDSDENTLSEFSVTLAFSEFIPLNGIKQDLRSAGLGDRISGIVDGAGKLFD